MFAFRDGFPDFQQGNRILRDSVPAQQPVFFPGKKCNRPGRRSNIPKLPVWAASNDFAPRRLVFASSSYQILQRGLNGFVNLVWPLLII